ncbi:PIN domain-like protein [Dipodascopsis uninucleata]
MGVPGLWEYFNENQLGQTIYPVKLAEKADQLDNRRLRIAIDGTLWSFKNKKSEVSPQKTFYYRLQRLLAQNIQFLFVFDGPEKAVFKRNKLISRLQPSDVVWMREIIEYFGFESVVAPGEAEAECAALQKCGIVDYVATDDVDALMFGAQKVLKGWKHEDSSLSSVSAQYYDLEEIRHQVKLTPEGMALVALMAGGDYNTAGVLKCGVKTAIEVARAGYGEALMKCGNDQQLLSEWKEKLSDSLRTNESNEFKNKHRAIIFADEFPQLELFNSYLRPIVSCELKFVTWKRKVNLKGIRQFARAFRIVEDDDELAKILSPALLTWQLANQNSMAVRDVSRKRTHKNTGFVSELRVSMIPADVVGSDIIDRYRASTETSFSSESSSQSEGDLCTDAFELPPTAVTKVSRVWIAEYIVLKSAKDKVVAYQQSQLARHLSKASSRTKGKSLNRYGGRTVKQSQFVQKNTIDKYFRPIKQVETVISAPGSKTQSDKSKSFPPSSPPLNKKTTNIINISSSSSPSTQSFINAKRSTSRQPESAFSKSTSTTHEEDDTLGVINIISTDSD